MSDFSISGPVTASEDIVLNRLRRAALHAAGPSPRRFRDLPLSPAPAWTASTTYIRGQRVTNGGYTYANVTAGTGGTSASSGGPTGTAVAAITDNTCTWLYIGVSPPTDSQAPTITQSTSAPTSGRFYTSSGSTFSQGSATAVKNNGWFERWGFLPSSAPVDVIGGTGGGYYPTFSFWTDAPQFTVAQTNSTNPSPFEIDVDGRFAVDTIIMMAATSGTTYTTFAFPDKRWRRVTIRGKDNMVANTAIKGVYVDQLSVCVAPEKMPGDLTALLVGDSYSVNTGSAESVDRNYAQILLSELGINKVFTDGYAGTGFLSQGTPQYTDPTRLAVIQALLPDVIVVQDSTNDAAQSPTLAQLITAITPWYTAVRTYVPNAWILATGIMGPTSAVRVTTEAYFASAWASFNDSKIIFTPVQNDPQGAYFTGTGNLSSPAGDGNADSLVGPDGVHPTTRGYQFIGRRQGAKFRDAILGGVYTIPVISIGTVSIPVNSAIPTISGTAQAGNTLTATTGSWTNSPTSYSYQWSYSDTSAVISGATSPTYALTSTDVGHTLSVAVTAINSGGSSSPSASIATAAVTAAASSAPVDTVAPTITGSPQVGNTLTSSTGTWSNSPTSYSYQWRWADSNAAISGATASTYTVVSGDVGHTIACTVTATNGAGSGSPVSSAATSAATAASSVTGAAYDTTFNGTSGVTYSNNNKHVTRPTVSTVSKQVAKSAAFKTSGLYYFQQKIGTLGRGMQLGVVDNTGNATTTPTNGTSTFGWQGTNLFYNNAGSSGTKSMGTALADGTIVEFAIRLDTMQGFARVAGGGGNWNNTSGADPTNATASSNGGLGLPTTSGGLTPFSTLLGTTANDPTNDVMLITQASDMTVGSMPSGFSWWPAS